MTPREWEAGGEEAENSWRVEADTTCFIKRTDFMSHLEVSRNISYLSSKSALEIQINANSWSTGKQHLLKTLVLNTLYVSISQMKQLQLEDG